MHIEREYNSHPHPHGPAQRLHLIKSGQLLYDLFGQPRTEECRPSDSVGTRQCTSNEVDMQAGIGREVGRGKGGIINNYMDEFTLILYISRLISNKNFIGKENLDMHTIDTSRNVRHL